MKALTKGQYEGIAVVFWAGMESLKSLPSDSMVRKAIDQALTMTIEGLAHQFQESDPEFKRELFLSQCGVTE